jgi:hypothetical protein
VRSEDGSFFAAYGAWEPPDPSLDDGKGDLSLAWDAAEQHGVTLLRQALPDARWWPAPVAELGDAAARIRSAVRKRPYRQLARAAWGGPRPPADDAQLWLEAAGAVATMRHHVDADLPWLAPVSVLRPADWAGAVIGLVRSGTNSAVTAVDLVRYARQPVDTADMPRADEAEGGLAYDPFASVAEDDESLLRGFEAALLLWEALAAVSDEWWLTGVGWWGLPRALARAWNGDFDSDWGDASPVDLGERVWSGDAPNPEDLGIQPPPLAF